MTARSAEGRASYANRIVKLAVRPPGTGGDAAESMILTTMAVTYHTKETSTFLLSATLTAANQNSTDAPGLYRSCPNGTPKFARRELTPSFSVHVFLLSLNARKTMPWIFTVLQHDNPVQTRYSRQTVRNDNSGSSLHQILQRGLNQLLTFRIKPSEICPFSMELTRPVRLPCIRGTSTPSDFH